MNNQDVSSLIHENTKGIKGVLTNINDYIGSLIDIGYGANSDKAIITVLVVASIFLSIASGYTTFNGLEKYTPAIIAVLLTLGIQGLLFGISWRLGKLYITGDINMAMWGIWFVTICVSVFFSYSSLFDTVYTESERTKDRESTSITLGGSLLKNLDSDLRKELSSKKTNINTKTFQIWKDKMMATIDGSAKFAADELNKRTSEYEQLKSKYEFEMKFGGTKYINSNGNPAISSPGEGKYMEQYRQESENYKKYSLVPYKDKAKQIIELRKEIIENIGEFERSKNIEYLNQAHSNCIKLIATTEGSFKCNSEGLGSDFNELTDMQKKYEEFSKSCSNEKLKNSFDENITFIRGCIIKYSTSNDIADGYLKKLDQLQKQESSHAHFFIIAVNEIFRFNYLAIGSLILAIVIDVLILLCSLVAARHTSFLNINDRKDLLLMESYPLDVVMGVDTEIHHDDNTFIKRIKFILNNARFDIECAKNGFSMTIPLDKIIEMKMHKELGTFLSMDLAKPNNDMNTIMFRTSFILWMCEQILRKKQSEISNSELYKAFIGENNE